MKKRTKTGLDTEADEYTQYTVQPYFHSTSLWMLQGLCADEVKGRTTNKAATLCADFETAFIQLLQTTTETIHLSL